MVKGKKQREGSKEGGEGGGKKNDTENSEGSKGRGWRGRGVLARERNKQNTTKPEESFLKEGESELIRREIREQEHDYR